MFFSLFLFVSLSSEAVHTFHILLNPQPSKPTTTPTTNTDFLQTCLQQVLQIGTGVKHIKKHTSMSHVQCTWPILRGVLSYTDQVNPHRSSNQANPHRKKNSHKRNKPTLKKKNSQTQQTHIEKLIQKKKNPTLKKKSTNATNLHRKNKTHKPKCKSERIEKIWKFESERWIRCFTENWFGGSRQGQDGWGERGSDVGDRHRW